MADDAFTLAQLEELTDHPERTIRSWIKAGVLPDPGGRGPGAHYGPVHLNRLLFLRKVRDEHDRRLPIGFMRQIFEEVPNEVIERVVRGEEPLAIAGLPRIGTTHAYEKCAPRISNPQEGSTASARERAARRRPPATPYTTIDVADGVELRMRGDDPERVARLARLARHLREWMASER